MRRILPTLPLATALLSLAACVAPSAPRQAAMPVPAPAPPPPPAPALSSDWRDWPVTPGDWNYKQGAGGPVASFGRAQANPDFWVRCDKASRRIVLSRAGDAGTAGQMKLHTSFGVAVWPVQTAAGATPYAMTTLDALDPALDRMAFSRGRFVIEVSGQPYLALPPWAEFLRVIEDCRG